jgi:hypothetical protein
METPRSGERAFITSGYKANTSNTLFVLNIPIALVHIVSFKRTYALSAIVLLPDTVWLYRTSSTRLP